MIPFLLKNYPEKATVEKNRRDLQFKSARSGRSGKVIMPFIAVFGNYSRDGSFPGFHRGGAEDAEKRLQVF